MAVDADGRLSGVVTIEQVGGRFGTSRLEAPVASPQDSRVAA